MSESFVIPKVILARRGKLEGAPTGSTHKCALEGCSGVRVTTRWPSGKISHPCSEGLEELEDGVWRIV